MKYISLIKFSQNVPFDRFDSYKKKKRTKKTKTDITVLWVPDTKFSIYVSELYLEI